MTSEHVTSVVDFFNNVFQLTSDKRGSDSELYKEYFALEDVPPAPGQPHKQHNAMVKNGLVTQACKNPHKNRYCNLFPFDTNLVKLNDNDNEDKYINASWIDLPGADHRYIATMGPMHPSSYSNKLKSDTGGVDDTVSDFWELCWQTGANVIVMLCSIQTGFTGCSPYYPERPDEPEVTFTPYKVSLKDFNEEEHFTERCLILEKTGTEETTSREIVHLQFKSWPNYGVPNEPGPISDFVRLAHCRAHEGPSRAKDKPELVVHCSGGIGRTGTFLAAYQMFSKFEQISKQKTITEKPEPISIFGLVDAMRRQRHPWMVEGFQQFEMAYDIILQLLGEFAK